MYFTLRLLTNFVTMVTEVTWSGFLILTHCPNTPTPSLIFNNFLKTVFNQGTVFQHHWWNVLFSMSNTHESHPQCLKKDLISLCKNTTWSLSCATHAASQAAMWTDGRHSCASVCSCDLLFSMGHTPLFILFTFVSHQLRCVCVYVKVLRAYNRLCVVTFLIKRKENNWVVTLFVICFERDYKGYESLLSGKIFVCLKCLLVLIKITLFFFIVPSVE